MTLVLFVMTADEMRLLDDAVPISTRVTPSIPDQFCCAHPVARVSMLNRIALLFFIPSSNVNNQAQLIRATRGSAVAWIVLFDSVLFLIFSNSFLQIFWICPNQVPEEIELNAQRCDDNGIGFVGNPPRGAVGSALDSDWKEATTDVTNLSRYGCDDLVGSPTSTKVGQRHQNGDHQEG